MDLDDLKFWATIGIIATIFVLAISIPICLMKNAEDERNFQLEKYKIEMKYKNGDVVENKE